MTGGAGNRQQKEDDMMESTGEYEHCSFAIFFVREIGGSMAELAAMDNESDTIMEVYEKHQPCEHGCSTGN